MKIALASFCNEISSLQPKEVIKVAGITRRIKNWLRGKFNPEYAQLMNELRSDTSENKILLKQMYHLLENIQSAIADGDVNEYEINFFELKELLNKFYQTIKEIDHKAEEYYQKNEMESEEFKKKFQEALPEKYDIPLNEKHHKPLKSFKWYENVKPNIIQINETGVFNKFLIALTKQAAINNYGTEEEIKEKLINNKDQILNNLKNATVDGTLIKAIPSEPGSIKRVPYGRVTLFIKTAPFEIPGLPNKVQCDIKLMDLTIGIKPVDKMSLFGLTHLTFISEASSSTKDAKMIKFKNLLKHGFQNAPTPYQVTRLNDVEFAKILASGYKKAFGQEPTAQILAGGWAQAILEAGRPVKLPNNNIGNIKAEDNWIKSGKPYFSKETGEFTKDGKYYKTPAFWKAFASPEEGAEYYWKYLKRKHPQALEWMAAEDPASATVALGLNGYFTANIKKYANGISSLYKEFMDKIAPQLQLKYSSAMPPGPKPEIKDWISSYSPEEKKNILTIQQNSTTTQEIDNFIKELLAYKPLTNLVKESLQKQHTNILTHIEGKNQINNFKLAHHLSYIAVKYFDATARTYSDGQNYQIDLKIIGNPLTVTAKIQEICDQLKIKLNDYTISNISTPFIKPFFTKEI